MTPEGITVDRLELDSRTLGEIAAVSARAFHHDPFFAYLSPRPLLRARGLALFCRSVVASLGTAGEVYGARRSDGTLLGVAAWIKPGDYPLPAANQLRQAAGAIWALAPRPPALVAGAKYLLAIEKVHPKEPTWYLQLLVVDPLVQRSGIGGALQRGGLDKADEEGLPCYLETQNVANIAYYGRFGYEVVHELHPVDGGPPLWTLHRDPRAPIA